MQYLVKLELLSPLLVGDRHEPSGYFLPSRDYIPGGVLRAAFARQITLSCPKGRDGEYLSWVSYHNIPECKTCVWQTWCCNFGKIIFSHANPGGSRVLPMTAYKCKYHDNHRIFDGLFDLMEGRRVLCPECDKGSERRAERQTGFEKKVSRRLIMRLAVDEYRGVAKEGQLYAMRVLNTGQVFQGLIESPDGADLQQVQATLRVGAKNSAGLGRVKLEMVPKEKSAANNMKQRVQEFNEKTGLPYNCLTVTLLSDALLDLGEEVLREKYTQTEELQARLASLLLSSKEVKPQFILADFINQGGYSTQYKFESQARQKGRLYLAAGSLFVFRTENTLSKDLLVTLTELEKNGIGERTAEGYGAVRICDEFHIRGGMSGDK